MPSKANNVMKKHPLIAIFFAATLVAVGCGDPKPGTTTPTDSIPAPDTVAIRSDDQECAALQPGQFCANGLDFLQLGDSLLWNTNIKPTLADGIMKDTVFTDITTGPEGIDTVDWFAKILRFPDGLIALDADFDSGQLLGRIRIESGRYHHSSGLRVGSTAKELKAFASTAYVAPFEAYKVMEIVVPYQRSRMIFHIPMEGIFKADKTEYTLADLPDDAKIVRIVLM
jgi:hypothetical protein